ncbi:MAG: ribonuclease R [Bacilli bacterium]|nr:ribonuclease R [Bacilli bacterium]
MREEVLDILKKSEIPLTELEIDNRLNNRVSLDKLCEELRTLEKCGDVYVTKKGKYTLYENTHLKVGKLSINKAGFGFVIMENEPDIHIKKENLNGAIHNDLVAAEYISEEEGRIVRILDRSFDTIIGEYTENNNVGEIILDDDRVKLTILIDSDHRNSAMPGHKVIVKPYAEIARNKYYGEVIKILGHKDDVGIDILSKVYEHDIEPNFLEETMEEIKNIPDHVEDSEMEGRRDLRNSKIITMDGDDAKDFDDAIGIEKLDNGNYLLGVHIADVTYYVKEGTSLGKDAEERATSVYLVDRVIPMLPHQLSNGICSLNPGVDRLTMSCDMEIDSNGKVVNYDVYEAVINSKLRMTYNKANDYLERGIINEGYENFTKELDMMAELSKILRKRRDDRGQLNFDVPEVKIKVDDECKPIEIGERERGVGEKLIEDFMIVANETVAEYITNIGYPMMYRIHEIPKDKKIREYFMLLKSLGHNVKIKGKITEIKPKQMQEVLDSLRDSKDYEMLSELGLRSMQKAIYSIENLGHFGLASKCYCHFTSPIRRYPDDTVHRVLKMILHGVELSGRDLIDLEKKLEREAAHSSLKERNAVECERDVEDMKMAEYMLNHIGEVFEAKVSSVVPSGMYVMLSNRIEGRVHVGSMKGDYYIVDEVGQSIIGKKSGKKYRLGDSVTVKCVEASKVEGTIDFELVKEINDEEEKSQ